MGLTELEKIDRNLVEIGRCLTAAENRLDYEMVGHYSDDIDRLLDRRSELTAAATVPAN